MEDLITDKRKLVRWERKHSNSLWHMDRFEYEGKNYVVMEDNASKFIGVYKRNKFRIPHIEKKQKNIILLLNTVNL